jgi:hypothetical protein
LTEVNGFQGFCLGFAVERTRKTFIPHSLRMNGLAILRFPAVSFQYIAGGGDDRFHLNTVSSPCQGGRFKNLT